MDALQWTDSTKTNHTYPYRLLVENALRNLNTHSYNRQRWAVVSDLFCIGSQGAIAICREFNLDPDELIKRR